MVGLVNAVGSYQASRVQAQQREATEPPVSGDHLAPILGAEEAASRVLSKAVEAVSSRTETESRAVPNGDDTAQFKQAELESKSDPNVGRFLDVVA